MDRHFRVWDSIEEEMHLPPHDYVILSDGQVRWKVTRSNDRTGSYTVLQPTRHDVTPMHHTGLDDAEGTPIYESDVVVAKDYTLKTETVQVRWDEEGGVWRAGEIWRLGNLVRGNDVRVYVRGDKFQTPELLND